MTYHVLNGDALVERFKATGLEGEMIIVRECLIEGDLQGNTLQEFYQTRAAYIGKTYGESSAEYYRRVAGEFKKLQAAPENSEFNLWFGYDLFCRANLWFIISLLQGLSITKKVYVVYPSYLHGPDVWKDFGGATPENLITCYNNRVPFSEIDLHLGTDLWTAYKSGNLATLEALSKQTFACFPYLEEVCKAHIERFPPNGGMGKPELVIADIIQNDTTEFHAVFTAFFNREGIYGFGDAQVKRIYDKVLQSLDTHSF